MENHIIEYVPFIFIATIVTPLIFPKLFWKKKEEKIKIIFYNIVKKNENPFLDESMSISIYDPDDQLFFMIEDIHDNDSYEDITKLFERLSKSFDTIYFVTYDIENKEKSFKLTTEDILENLNINVKFLDIKLLFYSIHPLINKILYSDLLEFYHVPKLECKVLEYCAIFEQVIQDYDINIRDDMNKMKNLYKQIHPLEI
jgi:hypothetical protein